MNLYPYQVKAVQWIKDKKRALLGSELGTGKSAVAIAAANQLIEQEIFERGMLAFPLSPTAPQCFVICSATMQGVWEKEIPKWTEYSKVQVIRKGKDKLDLDADWIIFSYDLFQKFSFKIAPFIVIIDECQALKSPRTKRTRNIFGKESIIRKAARIWLLTGTPFPNNLIDCWSPFSFCAYYQLGKYWEFANKYCYVKETIWGKQVSGARNLKELTERVRPFLHRDTVEEVLTELPGFQEVIVPLQHTVESAALSGELDQYKHLVRQAIITGKKDFGPDAPHISTLRRELGVQKIDQAAEFVKDLLDQGLSVVVFAHHREVVEKLASKLCQYHSTDIIFGSTSPEQRTTRIEWFQEGTLKCLVLSIRAGGVGITLTKAKVAVFVEIDWTPAALEQAMARIRRIGQKSFCTYYHLQFPDSLDETVYEAVKSKSHSIERFWKTWDGKEGQEEQINWDM